LERRIIKYEKITEREREIERGRERERERERILPFYVSFQYHPQYLFETSIFGT
jgi:hypothetical protein